MYDILLTTNLFLWLTLVLHYVSQPQASVFHPAGYYLFFHGLVFTFRPFLVYYRGYEAIYRGYQFMPTIEDKSTVMIATMLGLICFYAMVMKFGNAVARFPQDRINEAERRELTRPYLIAAALLVPIGLVSVLANWETRANDSTTMLLDAATGRFVNTSGNGYFDDAQLLLAPLTVLCVWLYRFKWWTFGPLVAFLILRGGTGGRWPIIMACASIALLYLYERRRRWPEWKAIAFGGFALFMFQVVGADRGTAIRTLFIEDRSSLADNVDKLKELRFLEAMDFANLEFFEYLVYVVPQRQRHLGLFPQQPAIANPANSSGDLGGQTSRSTHPVVLAVRLWLSDRHDQLATGRRLGSAGLSRRDHLVRTVWLAVWRGLQQIPAVQPRQPDPVDLSAVSAAQPDVLSRWLPANHRPDRRILPVSYLADCTDCKTLCRSAGR